nr:MAG TPA: U1 small nuclear ribonucleoprotein [Caudoviricetes sp.]
MKKKNSTITFFGENWCYLNVGIQKYFCVYCNT